MVPQSWTERAREIIQNILDEEDLSQQELASILGVTRQHINGIIQGRNEVTLEQTIRLEKAFPDRISTDQFMEARVEEMKSKIDNLDGIEERAKDAGLRS